MKIGLDFDGVISDCGQLKSDAARQLYGVDIPPEKFKKEIVVGGNHLTMEQYRELQTAIYSTREFGFRMKPVDGVLRYLPRLLSRGHFVQVITSREGAELEIAKDWTRLQNLDLEIIGVGFGNSKADAASGLDVFVDDDLDKLEPLSGVVPHRFLFSWGYNAHVQHDDAIRRARSVVE